MSRLQQKPILHGRDHLPGHPDPIPGLSTGAPGNFPTTVASISDLFAYYRLGEAAAPFADTSGFGTPDDLSVGGAGTALTTQVTGGLSSGDDGAVEFNYDGTSPTGGQALTTVGGTAKDFDQTEITVCAWVKVKASAITRRGMIAGTSTWSAVGAGSQEGWSLQVVYPSRKVRFTVGDIGTAGAEVYVETAGGVVVGDWNFFVGTIDASTVSFYVNGALVGTTANPLAGVIVSPAGTLAIGQTSVTPSGTSAWLYGTADEVAVWSRALTATEIVQLYESGVGTATSAGSQVLVSDGHGGFTWGQANGDAIEDEAIVDRHVAVGADIDVLKLAHPGGTTDFLRADGTWATPTGGGGASLTDTNAWMPLVDSTGICVLDSSGALIPTLVTI